MDPKSDGSAVWRTYRRTMLMKSAWLVALAAAGTAPARLARAETGYLNRPVRMIIPYRADIEKWAVVIDKTGLEKQ
jgi:hypothetical protein